MNALSVNYFNFNNTIEQSELPKGKGKRVVTEIYDEHDEQEKENFRPAKRRTAPSDEPSDDKIRSLVIVEQTSAKQNDKTSYSEIELLPFEMLLEIFRHLPARDLLRVEGTCKAFKNPCLVIWKNRFRELIRINLAIESSYNVFGLPKESSGLPKLTPDGEEDYAITPNAITACKVVEYLCPLFKDYLHQINSHLTIPEYYRGNLRKKNILDLREEVQLCLGLRVIPSGMQHGLHYVKKDKHNYYVLPSINVALLLKTSPAILKVLLGAGIPISNLDNYKNTLNAILKREDCRTILPLFVVHGVTPCIGTNNNTLNYAIQNRELHDLLERLLDLGAVPARSDSKGTTDTTQSVINNGRKFTQTFLLMTGKRREFQPGGQYFEFWINLFIEYLKLPPA